MDLQSLAYALVQLVHNFGAVAVAGGALFGRWPVHQPDPVRRRLAGVVLAGWLLQGVSGAGFGIVSYTYYGQFPDIAGVAVAALLLKMACALTGILLAAAYLRGAGNWSDNRREQAWNGLLLLGATAIGAAAFLRWFS